MATVYRALDQHSGELVAVKVFRQGIELDSTARMRREVELASALHDRGVVAVLDAEVGDGAFDGCAYLVTELVDGPTLAQRLKRSPLTEAQTVALGEALCRTLAYVHEQGIVHRDVKPANVLLAGEDDSALLTPKLADFGIALMIDSTRMTATGFTAGTANYLSPEQVVGSAVTSAADIYSLALILMEATTGVVAYPGHGIEAALARLNNPPRPPASLTPSLARLLTEMTAADPGDRPTAQVAARRLARIARGGGLASDIFAIDSPTQNQRAGKPAEPRSRRSLMAAAVLAAAAVGVTLMLSFTGSASRPPTHVPASDVAAATPQGASTVPSSPVASSPTVSPATNYAIAAPPVQPVANELPAPPATQSQPISVAGPSVAAVTGNGQGNAATNDNAKAKGKNKK